MKKSSSAAPRILLVDDNRNGLVIRKSVLEERGFQVIICDTPARAIETFSDAEFDAVVTDYRMPVMNGVGLIAELRAIRPGIPVVLISGLVEALGLDEKGTGADAVVAKNATEVPNLIRAIERVLRPSAPRKPAASQKPEPARRALR